MKNKEGLLSEGEEHLPNPVAAIDDGIIIDGLIEPLISDGGIVPELLMDDACGMRRVEEVCETFDGPRFPYGLGDGV